MSRPPLEVADIFNQHGDQYRRDHRLSLGQLQVMSALERCRTNVLGGHVLHCLQCSDQLIAYNSCRNRHCPKCCGSKAQQWLEDRKSELLPVEYYHVVFTLPAQIADIAYQNKAVIYGLLFKASRKHSPSLRPTLNTWVPRSALRRCCIPGAQHSRIILMCIASYPVADYTTVCGNRASVGSSCRYACCLDCSDGCSVNNCCRRIEMAGCSTLTSWLICTTQTSYNSILHRC